MTVVYTIVTIGNFNVYRVYTSISIVHIEGVIKVYRLIVAGTKRIYLQTAYCFSCIPQKQFGSKDKLIISCKKCLLGRSNCKQGMHNIWALRFASHIINLTI